MIGEEDAALADTEPELALAVMSLWSRRTFSSHLRNACAEGDFGAHDQAACRPGPETEEG